MFVLSIASNDLFEALRELSGVLRSCAMDAKRMVCIFFCNIAYSLSLIEELSFIITKISFEPFIFTL